MKHAQGPQEQDVTLQKAQRPNLLREGLQRLRGLFLPSTGGLHIGDNTLDAEADSGGNIDPFWKRADGTSSNLSTRPFSYSITVENPTSSEDISIAFTNRAITVTEMRAVLIGSAGPPTPSVTWTIKHHATDRNNAGNAVVTAGTTTTSTTTGDDVTMFDDATIPADSYVWLETTAKSGTVTEIHITIIGTED